MKKIPTVKASFGILFLSASLFACKAKNNTADTKVLSATDSVQLKEFEKWKENKAAKEKQTVVVYRDAAPAKESAAAPAPAKKKWSKAAKGAVIGGATGAVAGAVISKNNRAAGAVVGGVVGAGVGYGIGKSKDKKDKRDTANN